MYVKKKIQPITVKSVNGWILDPHTKTNTLQFKLKKIIRKT